MCLATGFDLGENNEFLNVPRQLAPTSSIMLCILLAKYSSSTHATYDFAACRNESMVSSTPECCFAVLFTAKDGTTNCASMLQWAKHINTNGIQTSTQYRLVQQTHTYALVYLNEVLESSHSFYSILKGTYPKKSKFVSIKNLKQSGQFSSNNVDV